MHTMNILVLRRRIHRHLAKFVWVLLCLNFFGTSSAAKEWRGIVPLKSTKADVLRLLGTPESENPTFSKYYLKDITVTVYYALGECSDPAACMCNVSKDTVINIGITLKGKVKFSQIREKGVKFEKIIDTHLLGTVHYRNDEIGIAYTVAEDKTVTHISYYESAEDCQKVLNSRTGNSGKYQN